MNGAPELLRCSEIARGCCWGGFGGYGLWGEYRGEYRGSFHTVGRACGS